MRGRILEFALATLMINIIGIVTVVLVATGVGEYIERLFETIADVLANINTFL